MNRYLVIRRLRGPMFLLLVGLIALLNQMDILSWGHAWPLFLILAGVLLLAERAALATEGNPPYPYGAPAPGAPPQQPPAPANPGTSIVPSDADDYIRRGGQS